jgi:hypothetical protein
MSDRRCKLTLNQVAQIRRRSGAGEPTLQIAKKFRITRQHVWRIVMGWQWKKTA